MKKLLLGLGVPKSATTWVHWALSHHPKVARIPRKEIHYFLRQYGGVDRLTDSSRLMQFAQFSRTFTLSSAQAAEGRARPIDPEAYGSPSDPEMAARWVAGGESQKRYRTLVRMIDWYKRHLEGPIDDDWYRNLFADVREDQWATDFSTTSFQASDRGYADMAAFADDTRAILILRDPLDRLWSHIRFHADVTQNFADLGVWGVPQIRAFAEHHDLHHASFYADAVERLMRHFPEDRRRIISFDRIKREPEAVFAELQAFLDLDPIPLPVRQHDGDPIAASGALPRRRGLLSHLAPDYIDDMKRLKDMGLDFVDPWIAHAEAEAETTPEFDPVSLRSRTRRLMRVLSTERATARILGRRRGD